MRATLACELGALAQFEFSAKVEAVIAEHPSSVDAPGVSNLRES
jgi:hypothetical protein